MPLKLGVFSGAKQRPKSSGGSGLSNSYVLICKWKCGGKKYNGLRGEGPRAEQCAAFQQYSIFFTALSKVHLIGSEYKQGCAHCAVLILENREDRESFGSSLSKVWAGVPTPLNPKLSECLFLFFLTTTTAQKPRGSLRTGCLCILSRERAKV